MRFAAIYNCVRDLSGYETIMVFFYAKKNHHISTQHVWLLGQIINHQKWLNGTRMFIFVKNRSTLDMNGAGKLRSKTREIWKPRRALHRRQRCVRRTDRWHPAKIIMNNLVVLQNICQHCIKRKRQSGNSFGAYMCREWRHTMQCQSPMRGHRKHRRNRRTARPRLAASTGGGRIRRPTKKRSVVMIRLYHGCCKKNRG